MDPRYKTTVRNADQTVHSRLARSKLASLLDTVQGIGYSEIQRFKEAVGEGGSFVSLHTLMYRLGYNVNCIGIFGSRLDHVKTRVVLQSFTEVCGVTKLARYDFNGFNALFRISTCYSLRSIGLSLFG